ncbi:EscU/YscU/HrcU family type III secretion system export apparatus switch protein [Bacillus gobiensis]|uniref:EscU/YscU/HrcU family type III secretion system export apparatus switch protein n=1 Tax=Bacillus gobiensis TaxID=1441095 RepID=UPI003D1A32E8
MRNDHQLRRAVALKYNEQKDLAPKVTAKGEGLLAEEIIKLGEEAGVPIERNPALVQLMTNLTVDELIPEALYEVVAEVFSFVYRLDKEASSKD